MLNSQEILKIHEKLDQREKSRREGNLNADNEDRLIANLANTTGWEVLKIRLISRIADLLEPIEYSPEVTLDVRGAMEEARRGRIEEIRRIIGEIETTKIAQMEEKKSSETSAKET